MSRGNRLTSLYIHIPFCAKKCRYCDFYSLPLGREIIVDQYGDDYQRRFVCENDLRLIANQCDADDTILTDRNNDGSRIVNRHDTNNRIIVNHDNDNSHTINQYVVNRYIDALIAEWDMHESAGVIDRRGIDTIYVGGGTPSLLGIDIWERLDRELFSRIDKAGVKEWSVECNPESFTVEKAEAYSKSGVTRLTFGVQSLNDRELSICGRVHNAAKALETLRDNRLAGMFNSIGADIIYALPGQTIDTLDATLTPILSIPHVKHLSAYELTIANGTPFGKHRRKLPLPDDDSVADMYRLLGKRCAERGMIQYEVSNYAPHGHESAHNKAYWSHKPYIGLGASAHSYIHPKRWGNVGDAIGYVSLLSSGERPVEFEETLTNAELAEEMIFLGLRNATGIDKREFEARTGRRFCDAGSERELRLREYAKQELLVDSGEKSIPTPRGMLFADMMARGILGSRPA